MAKIIYWRRELPPMSEQLEGEHELTANSDRVHVSAADRDTLWGRCYENLMSHARDRMTQEVGRLHGSCAHVLEESITTGHDLATDEFWLAGKFHYLVYVHPAAA
jgi:hypothetical protein